MIAKLSPMRKWWRRRFCDRRLQSYFMRLKAITLLCAGVLLAQAAHAADSTRYLPDKKLFVIDAGQVTYGAGINERNERQHIYWGKRLTRDADLMAARSERGWASFDLSTATTPQEYPGWGAGHFPEPCLKVTMADGNRDLVLHYVKHEISGQALTIELRKVS